MVMGIWVEKPHKYAVAIAARLAKDRLALKMGLAVLLLRNFIQLYYSAFSYSYLATNSVATGI